MVNNIFIFEGGLILLSRGVYIYICVCVCVCVCMCLCVCISVLVSLVLAIIGVFKAKLRKTVSVRESWSRRSLLELRVRTTLAALAIVDKCETKLS